MIKGSGQSKHLISGLGLWVFSPSKQLLCQINAFLSYFETKGKYCSTIQLNVNFFSYGRIVMTSYIVAFKASILIKVFCDRGRRWQGGRILSELQLCQGKAETHGSLQDSSSQAVFFIWTFSLLNFIKRHNGFTFFKMLRRNCCFCVVTASLWSRIRF